MTHEGDAMWAALTAASREQLNSIEHSPRSRKQQYLRGGGTREHHHDIGSVQMHVRGFLGKLGNQAMFVRTWLVPEYDVFWSCMCVSPVLNKHKLYLERQPPSQNCEASFGHELTGGGRLVLNSDSFMLSTDVFRIHFHLFVINSAYSEFCDCC
jgi:hypothetical protein